MERFSWDYEQYLRRPVWFDAYFEIKCKAEAEWQKRLKNKNTNGGQ